MPKHEIRNDSQIQPNCLGGSGTKQMDAQYQFGQTDTSTIVTKMSIRKTSGLAWLILVYLWVAISDQLNRR